jgi:hypothetical protein
MHSFSKTILSSSFVRIRRISSKQNFAGFFLHSNHVDSNPIRIEILN